MEKSLNSSLKCLCFMQEGTKASKALHLDFYTLSPLRKYYCCLPKDSLSFDYVTSDAFSGFSLI